MVIKAFFDFLKRNAFVLPAVLLAIVFYGGIVRYDNNLSYNALVPQLNAARLCGIVVSTPAKFGKKYYRLNLRLDSVLAKNGILCNAGGVVQVFVPAALCEMHSPGKLYSLWRRKKHGAKENFLINQGAYIELDVVAKTRAENELFEFYASNVRSCVWRNSFLKFRALCRLHFSRLMYAWGGAGGFILALLSGSREYLQRDLGEAFKRAGLSHILALSGMHLSLFSRVAFFIGKKSFGNKIAHALQLFAVLLFFWFAGKSPSLFRALLCSLCLIVGAAFHIKIGSMLNVLALSFLIHISIFPSDMFEMGFMLSYGALAGILCFNEFVSKPLSRALPYGIGNSLGQSTGAQALTIPVCLKYFGAITPGGIVASSVVSPIVTVFVYMALLFIVLCLACPVLAPVCGSVLGAVYSVLAKCVLWFARIPTIEVG